jgi:hypothetical protein
MGDPVKVGDLLLRACAVSEKLLDLEHERLRQNAVDSTPLRRVTHVLRVIPLRQMAREHASGHVAPVLNLQSWRQPAIEEELREPVDLDFVCDAIDGHGQLRVSIFCDASEP